MLSHLRDDEYFTCNNTMFLSDVSITQCEHTWYFFSNYYLFIVCVSPYFQNVYEHINS